MLLHSRATGIPYVVLYFIVPHRRVFNKLKAKPKPSTSKKMTTRFTVIVTLLWWSGTEPAISPRYACNFKMNLFLYKPHDMKIDKHFR